MGWKTTPASRRSAQVFRVLTDRHDHLERRFHRGRYFYRRDMAGLNRFSSEGCWGGGLRREATLSESAG